MSVGDQSTPNIYPTVLREDIYLYLVHNPPFIKRHSLVSAVVCVANHPTRVTARSSLSPVGVIYLQR